MQQVDSMISYHTGGDNDLYHPLDPNYTFVAADKSHARIIWDCAWSAEGDVFATASRDKTVGVTDDLEGVFRPYD